MTYTFMFPKGNTKDGPSAGCNHMCVYSALARPWTNRGNDRRNHPTWQLFRWGYRKGAGRPPSWDKDPYLPEENTKDLQEVPQKIKNDLCFIFVNTMDDVIEKALKPLPKESVNLGKSDFEHPNFYTS